MTKGGVITNKGSKAATFTDAKTKKTSYVDPNYVPRTVKTPKPTTTIGSGTGSTTTTKPDPVVGAVTPTTLADVKTQADKIQSDLNASVESGEIESSTPSPDEYYPRTYTPPAPIEPEPTESAEEIEKEMARGAQRQINELNNYQNTLLREQATINDTNNRSTASISTLTGTAGSTEANADQRKTTEEGKQANRVITDAVQVQIQTILSDIRKEAIIEARERRDDARLDAAEKEKNRITRQTEAQTNLTTLAQTGVTFDGLKTTDPEGFKYLSEQVGGEQMMKAMFTLNRSQETILDKKIENGKYVIAFQNPLDGKIRIETVDLGLPPQYSKTIDAGDRLLAIPDGWSGDPSELVTINKGLTPSQSSSGGTDGSKLLSISEAQTLGVPYGTTVAEAVALGKTPQGKVTGSQNDNLGFYNRGKDALENINKVEQAIADQGLAGDIQLQALPSWAQSKDQQLYRQAQRQFTEARLRKESGAAIPNAEYSTDSETYFAQPNDTAETLAQKKAAREAVLDSLAVSAGPAYTDYYGQEYTRASKTSKTLRGVDGSSFDASDLTPEEYQQALNDGYTPE